MVRRSGSGAGDARSLVLKEVCTITRESTSSPSQGLPPLPTPTRSQQVYSGKGSKLGTVSDKASAQRCSRQWEHCRLRVRVIR